MNRAPAEGERSALRGYTWQYDHIASLVYDSLIDDEFISLRLTDPDASRIDDLVLTRHGRTDLYQFKSSRHGRNLTFNNVVKDLQDHGSNATTLAGDLGDCWKSLRDQEEHLHVHLVWETAASVYDHLGERESADRPSPDHFRRFLSEILTPLRTGQIALEDVEAGWRPALERLREASGINKEDFRDFLHALHLDVGVGSGLPEQPSPRRFDIISLSHALSRAVSESPSGQALELNKNSVLELAGWEGQLRLRSRHEFPVDLDTYAPLEDAIEDLSGLIDSYDSGFIAIVGPPGSGKSTLLAQALTGRADRVVRYYAYIPRSTPAKTRLTSQGFLHDLVVMLSQAGLKAGERQIPSRDADLLREQLAGLLDAANTEFTQTGRKTILVVDGLDHVERDHPDSDSLLTEVPRPDGLPDGVLLIIGSRTTGPLHAHARQQLDEREAIIDLAQHPLSKSSIIEICSKVSVAAHLGRAIHERVADLCRGHPLSLGYFLNRLRDADTASAEEILAITPAYDGDIAGLYRAVWDEVEVDSDVVDILAVCSRLRTGFTTEWLRSWAPLAATRTFQRNLLYLFIRHHDGWRFFHDSFRQFAVENTTFADDTLSKERETALIHETVAEICSRSEAPNIAAEELYHRYCGGQHDKALQLADQAAFRIQFRNFRSPELIRADIETALAIAADRADVTAMVRLLLALYELVERASILEEVDLPGALFDAGLQEEAIVYSDSGLQHVPLAHLYGLVAKLGRIGHPAGRRIFDLVEHHGFEEPDTTFGSTRGHAVAEWAEAVVFFRPLSTVMERINRIATTAFEDSDTGHDIRRELWDQYEVLIQSLIRTIMDCPDQFGTQQLQEIDTHLSSTAENINEVYGHSEEPDAEEASYSDLSSKLACIADLRVQAYSSLLESTNSDALEHNIVDELLEAIKDTPLFPHTILEVANIFFDCGRLDLARQFFEHAPYSSPSTISELRDPVTGDSALAKRFEFLKLSLMLTDSDEDSTFDTADPIALDNDADRFASKVERALYTLAQIHVTTSIDQSMSTGDVWTSIVPILHVYPERGSQEYRALGTVVWNKSPLFEILCDVICKCGPELGQRFSQHLANIYNTQSEFLPLPFWLKIADKLNLIGVATPWYEDTLSDWESYLANEGMLSRLSESRDLIGRYINDGRTDDAKCLALRLIPMAFCVGYRKDRQFDSWVALLGQAIADSKDKRFLAEATWLARLLVAADPMTEGEPGSASVDLPAAVAPADPVVAVRIFEYLVRTGTADHIDCLASLVSTIVDKAVQDFDLVEMAVNITAELIAPTADQAHPDLAKALIATAQQVGGNAYAISLAEIIADRIDCYALETTRKDWKRGLGLEVEEKEIPQTDPSSPTTSSRDWGTSDYGSLKLSDGRTIARHEVISHIQSVEDICNLRLQESTESTFSWLEVLTDRRLTSSEVSALHRVFDDGTEDSARVVVLLAENAERNGDTDTALELAKDVMANSRGDSWAWFHGGERKGAAAMIVRLSGEEDRISVCQDLARQVLNSRWLIGSLLRDIEDIAKALDPEFSAAAMWPAVRVYLEGIAETLDIPDAEDLNDHGCRWWLPGPTADQRTAAEGSSASIALAELAVGHLSHPTWPVRDAAVFIVSRALGAGTNEVEEALSRFVQPESSDEILERAGRCLAAARAHAGYTTPSTLQPLEEILANHSSKVLRDLAEDQSPRPFRPLPERYQLELPPPEMNPIGSEPAFLAPYKLQYRILADGLGLELDTLHTVAAEYEGQALAMLPTSEAIREALTASGMRHSCPPFAASASRAAFGRVLADFDDAGLLHDAPEWVSRLLRTVDIDALLRSPTSRPSVIPEPPEAGMDQTVDRWLAEVEDRLEEYISSSSTEESLLIAAKGDLTVLDRGYLHEVFRCGAVVGASDLNDDTLLTRDEMMTFRDLVAETDFHLPEDEMLLAIENTEWVFDQRSTHWLAFNPGMAALLGWLPDLAELGNWNTASGHSAVKTVWWLDSWVGRAPTYSYDTGAEGHAVILTKEGLADILARFGAITRHFRLVRNPLSDETGTQTARAERSLPLSTSLG